MADAVPGPSGPSGGGGRLAENILRFARLLRAAGLPAGPDRARDAAAAVRLVGPGSRRDLYWCLFSHLASGPEQRPLFDLAFRMFWRAPHRTVRPTDAAPPAAGPGEAPDPPPAGRRLAEAMAAGGGEDRDEARRTEFDARFSFSSREALRKKDFERMSARELAEAKAAVAELRLPAAQARTRRFERAPRPGRVDMRASLRAAPRAAGAIPLRFRRPRRRPPPLVVLCDISGSMSGYSRMFLHFAHTLARDRDRVHAFVFGTRLSCITRHLRRRDVDLALDRTAAAVKDWSGGTRIGACLKRFNRRWSRRVLAQGAVVLLITDGLDRDGAEGIGSEMDRLSRSCRRLIWLNPLLRYEEFEPRARGIGAMLPYVDDFRPVHNLDSLAQLAQALSRDERREAARWRPAAAGQPVLRRPSGLAKVADEVAGA